ncbi:putative chalcone isomerase [Helianthus annuus]|nr:putative chalcone isomerase [Helianthus annuus]
MLICIVDESCESHLCHALGVRGLEIQGNFVKFTGIGVYLEDKAISSLAVKWKGKTAQELTDSVEFYRDIVTGKAGRPRNFFSGGADEGFNHIFKGCDRAFCLKNTLNFNNNEKKMLYTFCVDSHFTLTNHDPYVCAGPFEKFAQVTMILPLTGKQYAEKVSENCVAVWKALGIYTDADAKTIDKFLEIFSDQNFPPGSSILFTISPAGSLTVSSILHIE